MTGSLLEPPTDFSPYELLEWLEQLFVLDQLSTISRASILSIFPSGQSPDGAELDELFAEVRRRSQIAPMIYPFRDTDDEIVLDPAVDARVYLTLLVLSIEGAPFRRENRFTEINPDFELLTREALVSYSGPGAKGLRFGWPNGDGRPERLADAVEWLAQSMGLGVGVVHDEVDDDDKDGGIDVVAWKPFDDGSPSFTAWLAQCTVQATYERKTSDISSERWIAWIRFGKSPESVLSVPFAIPPNAKVRDQMKYEINVLLDRMRICEFLSPVSEKLSTFEEFEHMKAWTDKEFQLTRHAMSTPATGTPRRAKIRKPRRVPKPNEPVDLEVSTVA